MGPSGFAWLPCPLPHRIRSWPPVSRTAVGYQSVGIRPSSGDLAVSERTAGFSETFRTAIALLSASATNANSGIFRDIQDRDRVIVCLSDEQFRFIPGEGQGIRSTTFRRPRWRGIAQILQDFLFFSVHHCDLICGGQRYEQP